MRAPLQLLIAASVVAAISHVAAAQQAPFSKATADAWAQCRGVSGISAEGQIAGCTAVIQAGNEPAEKLAEAFLLRCQARGGEVDGVADCDRAIGLRPDYVDAYFARAKLYFFRKDYDRAIADYDRTIALQPNSDGAFTLRGMT